MREKTLVNHEEIESDSNGVMIDILKACNQSNKTDKDDIMEINTDYFIQYVSKKIIESSLLIESADNVLLMNNSHMKIKRINETLKNGHDNHDEKITKHNGSVLKANIISMTNFPIGKYNIGLKINSVLENEGNDHKYNETVLQLNHSIEIGQNTESILIKNSDRDKSYCIFNDYAFSPIHLSTLSIDHKSSGTSFYSFQLEAINDTNNHFRSINDYFIYLLMTSISDLCDFDKETITKYLQVNVYDINNKKITNEKDPNHYTSRLSNYEKENTSVDMQFILNINTSTRIALLNKVKDILSIPIADKNHNQCIIDTILLYFPEIQESINEILTKNDNERDHCCKGCIIY